MCVLRKNKLLMLAVSLTLLLISVLVWNMREKGNFTMPQQALEAYLSEVQQRPYSFEKAINYVDDTNLDDAFLQTLKEESIDTNAPTFIDFDFLEESVNSSNEKASIEVEFNYGDDYKPVTTFDFKKINGDWKLDLQNIQEEYYSIIND